MTTEIYPPLKAEDILSIENENKQKEQIWLIETVIKPELPNILETLAKCLDIITSSEDVKLPITSARTEQVKGVITRNSFEIVDLDLHLYFKTLPKKLHLKLKKHVEIVQLTEILHLITSLATDVHLLKSHSSSESDQFATRLNKVLENLIKCNSILNKPSESILFPKHKINLSHYFEAVGHNIEHYQSRFTIDIFLLNGELSLEFKSLEKVTESPWNKISPKTGKSHIDDLRDDLKHHKIKLNDILENEKKTIGQVLGFQKFSVHDYITRGITFDNNVVIEVEKSLIHSQDPNLLSMGAKLNGLEHLISKMFSNLDLARS